MRTRVVLWLALAAGSVFLLLYSLLPVPHDRPVPESPGPTSPKPAAKLAPSRNAANARAIRPNGLGLPESLPARWEQPVPEPEFAAFKEWTQRYQQASS